MASTTGISAPPMGMMMRTPSTSAASTIIQKTNGSLWTPAPPSARQAAASAMLMMWREANDRLAGHAAIKFGKDDGPVKVTRQWRHQGHLDESSEDGPLRRAQRPVAQSAAAATKQQPTHK